MSARFPQDKRITRGPELQRVLKEGKRIRTKYLDVRVTASPLKHSAHGRVGIIVPKAKHTVVERNQLKRRLRELVRNCLVPEQHFMSDVVLIARATTYQATFDMLSTDVLHIRELLVSRKSDT